MPLSLTQRRPRRDGCETPFVVCHGMKWQFQSTPRLEVLTLPIDVRIRTYVMNGNGDLEPLDDGPFEVYGTCPNVGDTVCIERANGRQAFSVVRRYYLNFRGWGWAVIVREIELAPQIVRVMDAWEEDVRFWGEVDREEERKEEARRAAIASHLLPPAKQPTKKAVRNPQRHTDPKPKPR